MKKTRVVSSGMCEITQGYSHSHEALDIVGKNYTIDYVIAHSDGVIHTIVDGKRNNKSIKTYGNYIIIDHRNGFKTLYAHFKSGISKKLKVGDKVKQGDTLGLMGESGYAFGVHLHWEVYYKGKRIDPNPYLNAELLPEFPTIPDYVIEATKQDELLHLVKLTIRGDFGNGEVRKQRLGKDYKKVQDQVNLNYKYKTTALGSIKLYGYEKKDDELLRLVTETISGKYGNGIIRKIKLGAKYKKVQNQVNLNYKYKTVNKPRLY